jgi:hypothetical protein
MARCSRGWRKLPISKSVPVIPEAVTPASKLLGIGEAANVLDTDATNVSPSSPAWNVIVVAY